MSGERRLDAINAGKKVANVRSLADDGSLRLGQPS
jgi:hypothetical protein